MCGCNIFLNKNFRLINRTYSIASAPYAAFMRNFRLFMGQCIQFTLLANLTDNAIA